jgi:hypothetical protein
MNVFFFGKNVALSHFALVILIFSLISCGGPPSRTEVAEMIIKKEFNNVPFETLSIMFGTRMSVPGSEGRFFCPDTFERIPLAIYNELASNGYIEISDLGKLQCYNEMSRFTTNCQYYSATLTEKGQKLFKINSKRNGICNAVWVEASAPLCKREFGEITGMILNDKSMQVEYTWKYGSHSEVFKYLQNVAGSRYGQIHKGSIRLVKYDDGWRISQ